MGHGRRSDAVSGLPALNPSGSPRRGPVCGVAARPPTIEVEDAGRALHPGPRRGLRGAAPARQGLLMTPQGGDDLTVVVPSFDEAADLPETVRELRAAFAGKGLRPYVLIVDDGSRDAT